MRLPRAVPVSRPFWALRVKRQVARLGEQAVGVVLEGDGIRPVDAERGDAEVVVVSPVHRAGHGSGPGGPGEQGTVVGIGQGAAIGAVMPVSLPVVAL